jgi:UDP-N-acetylglucosamine--N-acetylmuramyl-(pentapeptide) pyrophosphoryl-undecaprenol N-acetylglucosamine transferase
MSILMTGGGTGGHLAIIKAVKEYLETETLIYVGSTKGQDKQWFESDEDFKRKYFFETRGVVNQGVLGKVKSLFMMAKATLQGVKLIRLHGVKVVFSVGGFSAAPMAFAAKLTRTPLVIHEQNAALGSLNKLLQPYATAFISSYLEKSPIKAYPIKEVFFQKARVRTQLKNILFLGGSQGAKAINELALILAPTLQNMGIGIIHQAGENHIGSIKNAYKELGIEAEVFGFSTKLVEYMNEADFAIARSGASTLWELSAMGVPTLYIPYPYAASDHQYHNAQFLVKQNLAWVLRESELEEKKVLTLLKSDIQSVSKGLISSIQKEGSKDIALYLTQI